MVSTPEDTPISGSVLTGTVSVDGPVTVTQFHGGGRSARSTRPARRRRLPAWARCQIDANGGYTFTPAANFNGVVPVATYTLTDGSSGDTSTLTITVTPVDDAFTDANEAVSTPEDTPISGSVLTGTVSVDGPVTVTQFQVAGDAGGLHGRPDGGDCRRGHAVRSTPTAATRSRRRPTSTAWCRLRPTR